MHARKLVELATEHDWLVRATLAGFTDDKGGHWSIAIRLRRDNVVAWAIWIDGGFDSAAVSSPSASLNLRDLKAIITTPRSVEE